MWNLIQFVCFDLPYFLYKSADKFKWEGLIALIVYQIGRISGMRLFKKFLEGHFPYFKDETEDFKRWTIKQIINLGGEEFIPSQKYYRATGLWSRRAKNSNIFMKSSPQDIDQGRQYKMAKKKLVIDPGHGGKDSGAVSITGVNEKEINLNTALKVKELLKNNPNIDLLLTRETDVFIELGDRVKIAKKFKADCFISIHVNKFVAESSGTETEYSRDECIPLAVTLHKYLLQATGFKDRGIHKQSIQVTRETTMPAALAEPGFLSNPVEEAILITPAFADRYAEAVARAACEFLGVPYEVAPVVAPVTTPAGTYPVFVVLGENQYNGLIIDNKSWLPAKETFAALNFTNWTFKSKSIFVNGTQLETKILSNTSFIKATDLKAIGLLKNVFLDPDAINTKRVLLIPLEVSTNE